MFTRTASKIAFRELRSAPARFLFVVAAVTVGVAALSGIKGFGAAFQATLLHNAKQLIAADVQGQIWNFPTPQELETVSRLGREYGQMTRVTETISMAGSPNQRTPQLVSIKAVDPSVYPFYGNLVLSPHKTLAALLPNDASVVVTPETLVRLKVQPGDSLRIGGKKYRITGTIVSEPDRLASGFGPGMRIMMTRAGLDRAGLVQFGSRAAQRFLFKLSPNANLEKLKAQLKAGVRRVFISDYRDGSPAVGNAIQNTTRFLSLISLIALIVGALGVGMSIHSHVQQRMDTIGIMKALGGRSNQILQVFLIQTLVLGLVGALLGVAVGMLVQRSFPILMQQIFSQLPAVELDWSAAAEGLILGLLATVLFTVPALLAVREIRPNLVFRREMAEASAKRRWRRPGPAVTALVLVAGFYGISAWVAGSWRMGLYFVAGLAAAILVLWLIAAALMWALRRVLRIFRTSLPASLHHGMANVYRPGNHAGSVLVALGIGVMFTLTTYLLQRTILREITADAPGESGNVFMLDVRDVSGLRELIGRQPGVTGKLDLVGYIIARMVSKNGVPVRKLALSPQRKDQAETVRITTAPEMPQSLYLQQGKWWNPKSQDPQLAISDYVVRDFHLHLGDRVQFQIAGRMVNAPVVAVFRRDARASVRYDLVFPRDSLNGLPITYYATVHADPRYIPQIEAAIFDRFPTVTVMNLADVLRRIQQALDQAALVIRFLAGFAVAAGIIILSSSIAGTRYRRIREVALLKAVGATRRRIRAIFSVEFSILGLVAGAIGALLANIFTKVIALKFIETTFNFDLLSILICMIATAIVANAAGWLASARILQQRPLEVLRNE